MAPGRRDKTRNSSIQSHRPVSQTYPRAKEGSVRIFRGVWASPKFLEVLQKNFKDLNFSIFLGVFQNCPNFPQRFPTFPKRFQIFSNICQKVSKVYKILAIFQLIFSKLPKKFLNFRKSNRIHPKYPLN